jgi:thiosulfate/3-mercaptopyruvate sulfurtransferase
MFSTLSPQGDSRWISWVTAAATRTRRCNTAREMNIRFAVFLVALLTVSPLAAQTRATAAPLLVSTAWLADHLHDADLVVIQTSQAAAGAEQIPGARVIPHEALMTMASGHDLVDWPQLVAILERAGVSNGSHVVVYGEPLAAGWVFFALEYLGHDKVSMLDGGLEKWKAEGRSMSAVGAAPRAGQLTPHVRAGLKASADSVQKRPASAALVDARSNQEYAAGHIPGARLLTWQSVMADQKLQVFKSPAEVAALFAAAGASPGKTAITYCQVGLRSSLLYFAARYAGLNAINYVGSWSDWSGKGLPAEK